MIENEPNEITLIFHSDKPEDQKTRAYVEAFEGYAIKTLDLKRETLTETQLAEIANKRGVKVGALIDEKYADQVNISVTGLRDQDSLKLLSNDSILLNTPILIVGKLAYHYNSSYEFIRESASIIGVRENPAANVEERRDG